MDNKVNDASTNNEVDSLNLRSLSLGQKLLAKCVKKAGISVSVRGIAVNTTTQAKTVGSAWKSEKYDNNDGDISTSLDDISFPNLLGPINKDTASTKDRMVLENNAEKQKNDRKENSSNMSTTDIDHGLVGEQPLTPVTKDTCPLEFTNFIGKGANIPPPPPPEASTPFRKPKPKNKLVALGNKTQFSPVYKPSEQHCNAEFKDNTIVPSDKENNLNSTSEPLENISIKLAEIKKAASLSPSKQSRPFRKFEAGASSKNHKSKRTNIKYAQLCPNIDDDDNWRSSTNDRTHSPKQKVRNNLNFKKDNTIIERTNCNNDDGKNNKAGVRSTRRVARNNIKLTTDN